MFSAVAGSVRGSSDASVRRCVVAAAAAAAAAAVVAAAAAAVAAEGGAAVAVAGVPIVAVARRLASPNLGQRSRRCLDAQHAARLERAPLRLCACAWTTNHVRSSPRNRKQGRRGGVAADSRRFHRRRQSGSALSAAAGRGSLRLLLLLLLLPESTATLGLRNHPRAPDRDIWLGVCCGARARLGSRLSWRAPQRAPCSFNMVVLGWDQYASRFPSCLSNAIANPTGTCRYAVAAPHVAKNVPVYRSPQRTARRRSDSESDGHGHGHGHGRTLSLRSG